MNYHRIGIDPLLCQNQETSTVFLLFCCNLIIIYEKKYGARDQLRFRDLADRFHMHLLELRVILQRCNYVMILE